MVVVSIGGIFVSALNAHSEVWERAPSAGQAVGGTVDRVDISFITPIESGVILLAGPDGEPLAVSDTVLAENKRIITVEFDALVEPGAYVVTHTELSNDGDVQTDRFQFIYDPENDGRFSPLIDTDAGPNWILLAGMGGVILILAGIFWPGRSAKTE